MNSAIPRWRFWFWGFIFKSKHSPYNNLMVVLRAHKWDCRSKRWGVEVHRDGGGLPPGTRMIVLGCGAWLCVSMHITPYRRLCSAD